MAAADDRGPVGPPGPAVPAAPPSGAAARSRPSGLALIAAALIAALLAVAFVQARQDSLLRGSVREGDDYTVLSIYQVEIEYLRLREAWQLAIDRGPAADRDPLALRYEIWVSRLGLLENERTLQLLQPGSEQSATARALREFQRRADPILGPDAPAGLTPAELGESLAALLPELTALGPRVHDLSLHAAHRVAIQMTERNDAVRRHNQVGIALTLFLSALTLAFALIAWRQLRELEARRAGLELLAGRLREARQQADAANAAKSLFLAQMSHELRTPFQGLLGMLGLLRATPLDARQVDYLRTATGSAEHLLALLEDILDLSQLESGRMTLQPGVVGLRSLLRDVEALMQPQAAAKALALRFEVEPSLPDTVVTDGKRIKQVLYNLINNGIKFSQRGSVTLEVRSAQGASGQSLVEFVVSDSGIGMDEAMVAGLFGRGPRVRPVQRGAGAGLGLEICRNLARLMGGELSARSTPGLGSSFTFAIPLQPAAEPMPSPAQAVVGAATQPLTILVAEDQPVNREYLAAVLEAMGHAVHFVEDGEQAVAMLVPVPHGQGLNPDVVLMDLHMPVMDGAQATRRIRALPDRAAATVPIVGLTADAFEETRERCLVAGMNDFLTKPVSPERLAATLRRLFGASAAGEAPPEPAPDPLLGDEAALLDSGTLNSALKVMSRDRLSALIGLFLDDARLTVGQLQAAVREGQPAAIRQLAHAVRGGALNLGLSALAATAEALQQGASNLSALEIARLVQRFEQLLEETREAARAAGLAVPDLACEHPTATA